MVMQGASPCKFKLFTKQGGSIRPDVNSSVLFKQEAHGPEFRLCD